MNVCKKVRCFPFSFFIKVEKKKAMSKKVDILDGDNNQHYIHVIQVYGNL
ncbi:hypothetical protein protein [Bacillus cereus G9241]|nr:hypothetical protein protein [Bacillus cereus G9241]